MSLPVIAAAMLSGCAPADHAPSTDTEQIVQAVVALVAQNGPVCSDDHTENHALSVFKEMMKAPRPSRAQLKWHPPLPIRPGDKLETKEIRRAELSGDTVRIREPEPRRDALPAVQQMELANAALRLSREIGTERESIHIQQSWFPRNVAVRWWPLNRLRRDCKPLYLFSDPMRDRDIAFVTVRVEHWGTLYALRKQGEVWRVAAEWNRWLY